MRCSSWSKKSYCCHDEEFDRIAISIQDYEIIEHHPSRILNIWECIRARELHHHNRASLSLSHTGTLGEEVESDDNLLKTFITATSDDIFRFTLEMIVTKPHYGLIS